MKRLLAGSLMLAFALVLLAGAVAVSSQPAGADQCILAPSPFIYYGSACVPDPGTKQVGKFEWVTKWECLGYSATYGTPCLCTYLGCVKDPYQKPPNPNDQ